MTTTLLISGKGGVGKTTVAAATGIAAARLGHRTLVASLDRAHNLCAVLGVRGAEVPAAVAENLWVIEVDPQAELRRQWDELAVYFSRLLAWLGAPAGAADELAVLPGVEELVVLSRLVDLAESGEWDTLVVDLAPTASSLRYLSFPDLMAGTFGRLAHLERSFLSVARSFLAWATSAPLPDDALYEALDRLSGRLERLRALLTDPERCAARLVAIPEAVVLEETREALSAFSLFGIATDTLVLNRVLPPEATVGYLAA